LNLIQLKAYDKYGKCLFSIKNIATNYDRIAALLDNIEIEKSFDGMRNSDSNSSSSSFAVRPRPAASIMSSLLFFLLFFCVPLITSLLFARKIFPFFTSAFYSAFLLLLFILFLSTFASGYYNY